MKLASFYFKATPHVAGLVAYLIGLSGNLTPAAMSAKIQSLSVKGVLTGIRKYFISVSFFFKKKEGNYMNIDLCILFH